jgi:ribosomal protein S18 acetylase RimI-like enzyme
MIEIRAANLEDVSAIARVHAKADWETYAPLFGEQTYALDIPECEQRWRKALAADEQLLVATDAGAIVGFGHAGGNRVGALYLLSAYRRRGVGKRLLAQLLRGMLECGVAEAQFDVVAANAAAIAFYRAQGARRIGQVTHRDPRGDTEDLVFAIATGPRVGKHSS